MKKRELKFILREEVSDKTQERKLFFGIESEKAGFESSVTKEQLVYNVLRNLFEFLSLSEGLLEALDNIAEFEGRSKDELIEDMIVSYCQLHTSTHLSKKEAEKLFGCLSPKLRKGFIELMKY